MASSLLAITIAAVALSVSMSYCAAAVPAHGLTVNEGFVNPIGFYDPTPTFSWKLPEGVRRQSAYQIETSLDNAIWSSGWIESDQSTFVPYAGPPLRSRNRVAWRVKYRDDSGQESDWSEPARFELGLLSSDDWRAKWIRPAAPSDPKAEPVAYLRRNFAVDREVASARLYVTARGLVELGLNGQRVGQDYFANGFTSYRHRIDTLTYDVSSLLRPGSNTLQAMLGKGWYAGRQGWSKQIGLYGKDPSLLLQLEIHHTDGSQTIVLSDGDWEATWDGPVLSSSLYDGEVYDARKTIRGWARATVDQDLGPARLTPKPFAPVRATKTLAAQHITQPQPGRFVFDLGQNMVGWARIKVPAEKDKTITIRFAEMLNPDGTPYTAAYRSAKCTDSYTAAATGTVEWEPHFTFRGFRYVELSGLRPGLRPEPEWVTGVVLHSDLRQTGVFACSLDKLNRLQSNITWSQRGNFVDIPTDCPQRDERQGWTGDAQVFCGTSMFNFDSHAFWKSWLSTMRDDQLPDGLVPFVVPHAVLDGGCPGWIDAASIVPWEIYVRTGDVGLLADNYAMMEKLASWYRTKAVEGVVANAWNVGDWLQPYSKRNEGDTSITLIGSAYQARTVQILADAARVLRRADDAARYGDEAASLRRAFCAKYFDTNGRITNANETQTAYLLAIAFDLIPNEMRKDAAAHLVRLVHEANDHLRTGFLGTPYIVPVLDEMGYPDLALKILLNNTYPSWFYSIDQGATTLWERWNSYSRDKGFGNVEMNSFNHYAYGAIGQWLYERLAGLSPDPAYPGYKRFFVRPLVHGPLTSARAELETLYGKAASGWTKAGGTVTMQVIVPPNATATIQFPDDRPAVTVRSGTHQYTCTIPRR